MTEIPESKLDENIDDDSVTLIDLDGDKFEIIDTLNLEGKDYVALMPYSEEDVSDDDEIVDFTILEIIDDPDDEVNCTLRTIDDEDEYTRIGDEFIKRFEQFDGDDE
ncbi:MAG: DUF1292 domain-containing protein [Ruminiclostridium sp.]|nr:DUF1292 domain-containing protein [Ruminiclostridium sp.]